MRKTKDGKYLVKRNKVWVEVSPHVVAYNKLKSKERKLQKAGK